MTTVVLRGRAALAIDAGIEPVPDRNAFGGIALAHNVRSRDEVDEIMATAQRAGATVTRAAEPTSYGGYAGYFADPDGHLWKRPTTPVLRWPTTVRSPSRTFRHRNPRPSI